jgi:hypothetical protein
MQNLKGSIKKRDSELTIGPATAVLGWIAAYARDKYCLKSSRGIAFADFMGYERGAMASSARSHEQVKANEYPTRLDGSSAELLQKPSAPAGNDYEGIPLGAID